VTDDQYALVDNLMKKFLVLTIGKRPETSVAIRPAQTSVGRWKVVIP